MWEVDVANKCHGTWNLIQFWAAEIHSNIYDYANSKKMKEM